MLRAGFKCIVDVKTFLERAEAAYLSPLLVKPKLVCNKFQLSEGNNTNYAFMPVFLIDDGGKTFFLFIFFYL
jgi:hypothetical protein